VSAEPLPAQVPQEAVSQGTYALYETPKGGIHLVYRPEGASEDQHMDIPPLAVQAARSMSGMPDGGLGLMRKMAAGKIHRKH
jgi:hypothetical protein